jgi:hypothetical protein
MNDTVRVIYRNSYVDFDPSRLPQELWYIVIQDLIENGDSK